MTEKTNQHQNTGQPDNWLEQLFSQRNFTADVINNIPTSETEPTEINLGEETRWEQIKKDGFDRLLDLLQDKNGDVRESAAISLSGVKDLAVRDKLFEIASKRSNLFTYRQAALQALANSEDQLVQEYLVDFIVDWRRSLSFKPDGTQPQIKKNFYHGQAEAEYKNLIPHADTRLRNRRTLLAEAASAIGEIKDESILKKLSSISSSNFIFRTWEKPNGLSQTEQELRLNYSMKALQNPIKVKSDYSSKLIIEGFKSENIEIRQNAVVAAYINSAVISDKTKMAAIRLLKKEATLFEEADMTGYFGGILFGSDNPDIQEEIRDLILSESSINKQLGLLALRSSQNLRDVDYAATVLERTSNANEEYLAIKVLGEFVDRGKDVNNPGFDKAESILLHNFNLFSQKNDANRAALILALKNSTDKSYVDACIDLLFKNNSVLSMAASASLMHSPSRELNKALLGILDIKDETSRHIVGGVCKILCQRLDNSSTSHLIKILEIGDDLKCIHAVSALSGTKNNDALKLMLKIARDRVRHPELRAEAIYSISQTNFDHQNTPDRDFKRDFTKVISSFLSDKNEDFGVRLSALNALPNRYIYKAIDPILAFAKGPDPILAEAALTKLSGFKNYKILDLFLGLFSNKENYQGHELARSYLVQNPTVDFLSNLIANSHSHDSKVRAEAAQSLSCLKSI